MITKHAFIRSLHEWNDRFGDIAGYIEGRHFDALIRFMQKKCDRAAVDKFQEYIERRNFNELHVQELFFAQDMMRFLDPGDIIIVYKKIKNDIDPNYDLRNLDLPSVG